MGGYLRQHQIDEIENEKHVIERTLTNQRDIQDRGNLESHLKRIDKQIAEQAPPDLTGEERDRMSRECREIEERLVPMMPSDEEMRRNPSGVVGRHMRYEKASKSKDHFDEGDIFRWKDNQLALNKGDDDPDVANFERMRPLHNSGSMLGAQISGQQYFGTMPTQAYREGYERTFAAEPAVEEESESEIPQRQRKPATRKKKAAKKAANKKSMKMTELACGKMMGPHGRHFHVKKCEICQEAAKE
jgi:hypothetical protein